MTAQLSEAPRALTLGDFGYRTIPAGLTGAETRAYWTGYGAAVRRFNKLHGIPSVTRGPEDGPTPAVGTPAWEQLRTELATLSRAHRIECHPGAHDGGMRAVRKLIRDSGDVGRLEAYTDRKAPSKARKLAAVPDPVAPAVRELLEHPRVTVVHVTDAPVTGHDGDGRTTPATFPPSHPVAPAPVSTPDMRLADEMRTADSVARTVDVGDLSTPPARRVARRALADALRVAGIRPSGAAWDAACLAIGLPR